VSRLRQHGGPPERRAASRRSARLVRRSARMVTAGGDDLPRRSLAAEAGGRSRAGRGATNTWSRRGAARSNPPCDVGARRRPIDTRIGNRDDQSRSRDRRQPSSHRRRERLRVRVELGRGERAARSTDPAGRVVSRRSHDVTAPESRAQVRARNVWVALHRHQPESDTPVVRHACLRQPCEGQAVLSAATVEGVAPAIAISERSPISSLSLRPGRA
jgi:hypothetical protein